MSPVIKKHASLLLMAHIVGFSFSCTDARYRVLNGIDVLVEQNFKALAGKRIGLVTNQTGRSSSGASTIDLFHKAEACKLTALFSPEHGIRGARDGIVRSSVDESTGITIHSLYGENRRPTAEMLKNIDALVFDIQDIGARFYTYITTMAYCMEEAAKAGIPFYVLDRPNPLGGTRVEGPMLDADRTSFTGYMPLPVRHGMTVGELARYFNEAKNIGANLHIVEMKGWRRSYYFWDTGQIWIDPSPNMRSMAEALLYPGVCLLEGTNVSVGRGTDRPFEMVGAPWIKPRVFSASLLETGIPGVRFIPVFFTPESGTNREVLCGGVNLLITDIEEFNPVLLGFTLISILYKLYPDEFDIDGVMELLGNAEAIKKLKEGRPPVEAMGRESADLRKFMSQRRKALIYDKAPN
jgi:uncharacterized protein YbbC (DUF1343 family)